MSICALIYILWRLIGTDYLLDAGGEMNAQNGGSIYLGQNLNETANNINQYTKMALHS